jgi:glycosyltransferase involved in cell wall biosynthesis
VTTEEPGAWFGLAASHGLRARAIPGARWTPGTLHARRVGRDLARGGYDTIFLNHSIPAQASLAMLPDAVLAFPVLHSRIEAVVRTALANPYASNAVVAVSPRLLEIARARRPDRPVILIPHGVEIPEEVGARVERKGDELPFRLAWIGRLDQESKGVLLLPEILARCIERGVDARLTIAGDGPEASSLDKAIAARGLAERVDRRGWVTPEEAEAILLDAHALILPSFHEGLPLVLIEAQACGCAAIASHLPGITDFVSEDGRTGLLVPPGDTEGFAAAIARLADDRAFLRAVSIAGHVRARERFTIQRMVDAYLRLIDEGRSGRLPTPRPRRDLPAIDREIMTWRDSVPPYLLNALRRARAALPRPAGFA